MTSVCQRVHVHGRSAHPHSHVVTLCSQAGCAVGFLLFTYTTNAGLQAGCTPAWATFSTHFRTRFRVQISGSNSVSKLVKRTVGKIFGYTSLYAYRLLKLHGHSASYCSDPQPMRVCRPLAHSFASRLGHIFGQVFEPRFRVRLLGPSW